MGIFEAVAGVLVVLWLIGFALHIAGGFIHILLVLAILSFLMRFLKGRSTAQ